jgi:hypothetical protein
VTVPSVPPLAIGLLLAMASCRSSGSYGYAKAYSPTSDETKAVAGKQEYEPAAVERFAGKLKGHTFWLFGVVTHRAPGPGGAAYLAVSLRGLAAQNHCSTQTEESCRVTVSEREMGRVHLLVPLAGDDDLGERSVGLGSLVRVVGTVTEDVDPHDGTPVLRTSFFRHWPRGFYATAPTNAPFTR